MGKFGNKNPDEAASHMDSEGKDCIGYMPINRKVIWDFAAMSRSALAIFFFRPIRCNMLMTKLCKVGITRGPDFLLKSYITNIMAFIFNTPMSAGKVEKTFRICLGW